MKIKFLGTCILVCACSFLLALGIKLILPGTQQEPEHKVYRNGKPVAELFPADEELLLQTKEERAKISVEIDTEQEKDTKQTQEKPSYNWYSTPVYVEGLIPGIEYVVVLEYLNLRSEVLEALLYEPDFSKSYSKEELSSDGKIVFPLPQGKEGTFTVVIYGTGDIGGFTTYIVKKEEFLDLQKPNEDYPRDLMREDVLIDE